jgi:hypothetical protein
MEVTDSTKTIVGVTFGYLYDQMYDDARRNSLVEAVGKFTQDMLMDPGIESKVSDRKYSSWTSASSPRLAIGNIPHGPRHRVQ